jgi:hypothetical protein
MNNNGRKTSIFAIAILLLAVVGSMMPPAAAGEKVLSGSPELSAAILGANEFFPGEDATIPVIIQNSGLIQYEFTYPTTLTPRDLPNTAKLMEVTLEPGDAPVIVKSDPQMVGDLKGGSTLTVQFKARIADDASSDAYILPLNIRYTYLWAAEQYGLDQLQYIYKYQEVTIGLPIKIKPRIMLEIVSMNLSHVNVGTEGFLSLNLKNNGNEDGSDTVVKLSQVGNSPVTPVASSVYIGDFPRGSVIPVEYKIAVSNDAEPFSYPVNVSVVYRNRDGDTIASDPVTVGVPVSGKIDFSVVSPPPEVNPGSQTVLEVVYENTGAATAYDAKARISTADPFTTKDDTSYLGDIAPGETKSAKFEVAVAQGATIKEYGLDSEVRYRDALDNDQVSDRVTVPVKIVPLSGVLGVILNPYFIVLIIAVIAVSGYLVLRMRRQKGSRKVS